MNFTKQFFFFLTCCAIGSIGAQTQTLVPYRIKTQWGYSNYEGKIIITPQYDSVCPFLSKDGWKQQIAEVIKNKKKGYILQTGAVLIPPIYDSIQDISRQAYKLSALLVSQNKKWGVVSFQNKIIVPIQYDSLAIKDIQKIANGMVYPSTGYRYIAKKGNQHFTISSKGVVSKMAASSFADEISTELVMAYDADYYRDRSPATIDTKAITANNGDLIDSMSVQEIGTSPKRMYKIFKNKKVGLVCERNIVNMKITKLIGPLYDTILDIDYDYASNPSSFLVKRDSMITVLDTEGRELMPLKYKEYQSWNGYVVYTRLNNKIGCYHLTEKYDIEPKYDAIQCWDPLPLWRVRKGNSTGLINKEGFEYFQD